MQGSSANDGGSSVRPATGKLGILTPGLGAVATTFMAGVESIRRGLSAPIGSLTQMATIRLGKRTENRGTARVHRYVVETPVEKQVALQSERVVIERRRPDRPLLRPFLGVGVLGGYTTFSTFAVESVRLVDAGAHVVPVMTRGATRFVVETTFSALALTARFCSVCAP